MRKDPARIMNPCKDDPKALRKDGPNELPQRYAIAVLQNADLCNETWPRCYALRRDSFQKLTSKAKSNQPTKTMRPLTKNATPIVDRAQRSRAIENLKDRTSRVPSASVTDGEQLMSAQDILLDVFPKESSRPSQRWIRKLAMNGEIPSVILSGRVFFPVERVRALLTGTAPRKKPAVSEMSRAELWSEYSRVLDASGREAAHRFYQDHITQK